MKIKLPVLAFLIMALSAATLKADDKMSYRDHNLINGGFSLGYYSYGYLGSRSIGIPPLYAYYETGIHDYITVGPFAGFARWSYSYNLQNYSYSWTFINVGGRGSFHITGFMNEVLGMGLDEEKIDWYISLLAGVEFRQYSSGSGAFDSNYGNTSNFFIGPVGGVRYYFSDSFGVFFEGGRGALGAATFGVTVKL